MKEVWKGIPEFESYYEVSDLGRVRSLDRVVVDSLNRTFNKNSKYFGDNE